MPQSVLVTGAFGQLGDELWQRFSVHDPRQHLWYY